MTTSVFPRLCGLDVVKVFNSPVFESTQLIARGVTKLTWLLDRPERSLQLSSAAHRSWVPIAVSLQALVISTLPEISGHGPIFSVYSSVYAIVEVNGRRWELGIKHRC